MLEDDSWIGLDESGKGDYFGPLVVAGVHVVPSMVGLFQEMGVRDSKRLSDKRVHEMDSIIRRQTSYSVVSIGPERYNELYEKFRNLNRLLAWAHARALENLLAKVNSRRALADQFGDVRLIQNALLKEGKKIVLEQRTHAEEDIAVAAASIVARSEFLRRLSSLAEKNGLQLPKGASTVVEEAIRRIVSRFPDLDERRRMLKKVAKWHFRNTRQAMGT